MKFRVSLIHLILFFLVENCFAIDLNIFLKPSGSDLADGRSWKNAVASLQVAVDMALSSPHSEYDSMVVNVASGEYVGQRVLTKGDSKGRPLTITSRTNLSGGASIFNGGRKGGTWFFLNNSSGQPTNIVIEGLEITNYVNGITLKGNRNSANEFNGNNVIKDNVLKNIGQIAFPEGRRSSAALLLWNSSHNIISGNKFQNIRNVTGCSAMHSIYIAHYSSENLIENNEFTGGCGTTIKTRDAANNNIIKANRFYEQETNAIYLDGYCNHDSRKDCTKPLDECPSWGNEFMDNFIFSVDIKTNLVPVLINKESPQPSACPNPLKNVQRIKESGTTFVR